MKDKASIARDPFEKIDVLTDVVYKRRVFTPKELEGIQNNANDWQMYIYMVGIHTGLRKADMCLLRWSDVDLDTGPGWLNKIRMRKTGVIVDIPMIPALKEYLQSLPRELGQVYVHPFLADKYETNEGWIGRNFCSFLKSLDIVTSETVPGRDRPVKLKDIHSFRHGFVYMAGMHRVPLALVQSIVGHMNDEMTKAYNDHADRSSKAAYFGNLDFLGEVTDNFNAASPEFVKALTAERDAVAARLETATFQLRSITNMLSLMTAKNMEAVKDMIITNIEVAQQEIVVESIEPAQIA